MSSSNWVGKTVGGRYQVEELLGQGGMSSVYKATDPNLKRVVAIKMIHPHLSAEENFVRRFEEEASAVAQLRHPHIIQVHDFDHQDDIYYMVLEFVPGETLQERLKRLNKAGRQMPPKAVVKYMTEICQAVDYAHERGMIHRDLKPANVMLSVQNEAILMDFGIVKIVGGQHHTATGAVIGTALYMSPEQIKGVEIDRRSDIYSLGVMLFEMVSGRAPFEADSAMTLMMMHVNDPVPNLREMKPELPVPLIHVIEKALAKEPGQRYQTAAELAAALKNALTAPAPSREEGTAVEPAPVPAADPGATYMEPQVSDAPTGSGTYIEHQPARTGSVPASMQQRKPAATRKRNLTPILIGGGAIAALALIGILVAAFIFIPRMFDNNNGNNNPSVASITEPPGGLEGNLSATADALAVLAAAPNDTETPTQTMEPTGTPTETPTPTDTHTPTITPSPTFPTDLYTWITDISIDGSSYVVEYETYGFEEILPGTHVHFFFDTVPVDQAGNPGSGPWKLYGGPRPFTGYLVSARPADAMQMCIRVANPDHSLYDPESGNCYDLPETP